MNKLTCFFMFTLLVFISPSVLTAENPNIILIMADDVSWEAFSCYGAQDYKTPRIDDLAAKGVRFNHCYSTPICTTSRVKIMTGKYNFRNYTHFGYLNPVEKTFGNMLQSAGYKTAIAGKWQLNGLANSLPGFKDSKRPYAAGFDEYMLWQLTKSKNGKGGGERFWNPLLEHNEKMLTKEMNRGKYGPDMLCDFVCEFMERNKDEAFFVYYPMVLVHDPFVPTPDTIEKIPTVGGNKEPKGKSKKKENFVAMVQYMDKIVGRIVDKVEEIGETENTIILFTADNGTNGKITSNWNGQSIQGGKGGMTDMGTHVPLIAYWKGHTPAGVVLDDLIDFTDFYTTFAEAANAKTGDSDPIDGVSFLPQLNGKIGTPREFVFCHYEPYWNKTPGQFIRNAEFKLYHNNLLYNVPKDLKEANPIDPGLETQTAKDARSRFSSIFKKAPPAPHRGDLNKAGRDAKLRPVYPDWHRLSK